MSKIIDYTGWVMSEHDVEGSKLTVVKGLGSRQDKNGHFHRWWLVQCSCGSEPFELTSAQLRYHKMCSKCRPAFIGEKERIRLNHEINEEFGYAIVYTTKGEPFWIDLEDLDRVLEYCWSYSDKGYLQANSRDKTHKSPIMLHRFIMGLQKGDKRNVDHIVHTPKGEKEIDHRKRNLRITTGAQNNMNSYLKRNNTSGVSGVYFSKAEGKWKAEIRENNNYHFLGTFENKEDAISARKRAEKKYWGEYAFDVHN